MTLMLGGAPFGQRPFGQFNFEVPEGVRYVEAIPRRVRGELGGETVIDSTRAHLLHRQGFLAVWCFPPEDVHAEGAVDVGDGLVHVPFDDLDAWYEEDEQVFGHARDPYSRIDVIPTSRHVRVSVAGEALAETTHARAVFETGLPPRWYIERDDVRMDRLTPVATTSRCAYKGLASYFDSPGEPVIAWTYEDPHWDGERVRGLVCFFNERVDLELDGVLQERPRTPWSDPAWAGRSERASDRQHFD